MVVNSCIEMHRCSGPGLLESVHQKGLAYEVVQQGLRVQCDVPIPVRYDAVAFQEGFRADILVEGKVVLALKSVGRVAPVHMKPLQAYLELAGIRWGYLLNDGEVMMKTGIKRAMNNQNESSD